MISSINLSQRSGVQEVLLQRSYEQISTGGGHPGSHGCALYLKVMEGVEGEVVVGKVEVSDGGGRASR